MIEEVKPPADAAPAKDKYEIFLAGSIEQGKATEWQDAFVSALKAAGFEQNVTVFNPRRENWDASWKQSLDSPKFVEQVEWELEHIERSHLIVMYLQPDTKSPISLLELGLVAKEVYVADKEMIVLCPEGFYRKGNVDVVCQYYDIAQAKDMNDLIAKTIERIKDFKNPTLITHSA